MNQKFIDSETIKNLQVLFNRKSELEEQIKPVTDELKTLTDKAIAVKFGLNEWNITALRLGKSYTKNKEY